VARISDRLGEKVLRDVVRTQTPSSEVGIEASVLGRGRLDFQVFVRLHVLIKVIGFDGFGDVMRDGRPHPRKLLAEFLRACLSSELLL